MSERIGARILPIETLPVNSNLHEEFVALCAVYYSGEISDEEWALLQVHLAYCDSCHERFLEYQRITSSAIPALASAAASEIDNQEPESTQSLGAAEGRLMSRLDALPPNEKARRPSRLG